MAPLSAGDVRRENWFAAPVFLTFLLFIGLLGEARPAKKAVPPHKRQYLRQADALLSTLSWSERLAQFLFVRSEKPAITQEALALGVGGLATSWHPTSLGAVASYEKKTAMPMERGTDRLLPFVEETMTPCAQFHALQALRERHLAKEMAQASAQYAREAGITRMDYFPEACRTDGAAGNYEAYVKELDRLGMATHSHDHRGKAPEGDMFRAIKKGEYIFTKVPTRTHRQLLAQVSQKEAGSVKRVLRRLLAGRLERRARLKRLQKTAGTQGLAPAWLQQQLLSKSVTVLKNEGPLLPIREMTAGLLHLAVGDREESTFKERVWDYMPTDYYKASLHHTDYALHVLRILLEHPTKTLLLSWHRTAEKPSEAWVSHLRQILAQKRVILVLFNTLSVLNDYPFIWGAEAIVCHYTSSARAADYTAQCIFGGLSFSGRLPYAYPPYAAGAGTEGPPPTRLSFVVPEAVGIDSDSLQESIGGVIEEALQAAAFPGCQILAAKGGKIFFLQSYGHHSYAARAPVERTHLYDVASLTKATAALPVLMKLHDEGKFSVSAKIGEHLPAVRRSNKADISFRQALAHRAGFVPEIPYRRAIFQEGTEVFKRRTCAFSRTKRYPTPIGGGLFLHKSFQKTLFKQVKRSPISEKKTVYSSLFFYLVPPLVERLSGQGYLPYLTDNFLKPMGIASFAYNPLRQYAREVIVPTERDDFFRKDLLHGHVHDEVAALMGGVSGHAGLFANVVDVAKMWQMYLQHGTYGGRRYLAEETIKAFTACQYCQEGHRKALGFDRRPDTCAQDRCLVASSSSQKSFGHSGYTGTLVWADPVHDLLYVFLSNRVHPERSHKAIYRLNVRPRVHQILYDALGIPPSTAP